MGYRIQIHVISPHYQIQCCNYPPLGELHTTWIPPRYSGVTKTLTAITVLIKYHFLILCAIFTIIIALSLELTLGYCNPYVLSITHAIVLYIFNGEVSIVMFLLS